jgi:mannan endo-1,4-beta-mannosidase
MGCGGSPEGDPASSLPLFGSDMLGGPGGSEVGVETTGGAGGAGPSSTDPDGTGEGGMEVVNVTPPSQPPSSVRSVPGVVVLDSTVGVKSCVPICVLSVDPALDADGWSYEGTSSCIIPMTRLALSNQPCTTGAPVPPPRQVPGVVTVDGSALRCTPICVLGPDPADTIPDDDWSYEDNLPCVFPTSDTALGNQSCNTGGALPDEEPRPGILVAADAPNNLDSVCRPLCAVVTQPSDPLAPDWSYENNNACVLPASPTAQGRRACTFGAEPLALIPPALPLTPVRPGFYVEAGRLRDPYGADFVIRGVNSPHIYFDTAGRYQAFLTLDDIAALGANTVRVVWDTTGPAAVLREVLYRVVELSMVPIVELHDVTGEASAARLLDMAEYYVRPDVRAVLRDFREYLLVNIANEWSGSNAGYFAAYRDAVSLLRTNGVDHTLVIDANAFGQNGQVILDNAVALQESDAQHNLLFSVHMYQQFGTTGAVDALLAGAVSRGIPLIVGEFGHRHSGQDVAWERILVRTAPNDLNLGYIAWSWFGNDGDTAELDLVDAPGGALTQWGRDVMTTAPGNIQDTAHPPSIF